MPPEAPKAGSAKDWLRHAQSDLALARMRKTKKLLYEHLCFHAQQAAEKALKAVLVHCEQRVPRNHDLAYLIERLPSEVSLSPSLIEVPVLTKYAVQRRYPGEAEPLTSKHRRRAVSLAEDAIAWAARVTSAAAAGGSCSDVSATH